MPANTTNSMDKIIMTTATINKAKEERLKEVNNNNNKEVNTIKVTTRDTVKAVMGTMMTSKTCGFPFIPIILT